MDAANQLVVEKTVVQSEKELVEQWLVRLDAALQSESSASVASLFAPDGHWRDLLAFTWSITPCQGAEDIAALMVTKQGNVKARGFAIAEGRTPPRRVQRAGNDVIEGIFQFETGVGRGFGVVRLLAGDGESDAAGPSRRRIPPHVRARRQRGASRLPPLIRACRSCNFSARRFACAEKCARTLSIGSRRLRALSWGRPATPGHLARRAASSAPRSSVGR